MTEGPGNRAGERLADERLLLERYHRTRDQAVREELVDRFLPLARSLANRYAGGPEPTEDLHQVASLGLVKAIEGFDPTLEHVGELRGADDTRGAQAPLPRPRRQVHLPRGSRSGSRTSTAPWTSCRRSQRAPSAADVAAAHTGLDLEQVLEAMEAASARRPYSLDAAVGSTTTRRCWPTRSATRTPRFRPSSTARRSRGRWRSCPSANVPDLNLRFVEDLTQSEIVERVGIFQMHVSRLLRRAPRRGARAGPAGGGTKARSRSRGTARVAGFDVDLARES